MTIRDMIDGGITIQGHIKIQCFRNKDYADICYDGYIEEDGINAIEEYLDREITYIFPYVFNIGNRVPVWIGAICIELKEEI